MCKASLNHRRKGSLAFLWCSMLWKSFALAVRRNGRAALKSNDYVIMPLWWENNIGSKFSTPIYRLKKNNTYGICSLYNHEHPEVQHVFHWLQVISFDTPTVLTDLHVTSKGFSPCWASSLWPSAAPPIRCCARTASSAALPPAGPLAPGSHGKIGWNRYGKVTTVYSFLKVNQ